MTLASNFNSLSSIFSENSGNFSKKRSDNTHLGANVVLLDSVKSIKKRTLAQYYHILTLQITPQLCLIILQLITCILPISMA